MKMLLIKACDLSTGTSGLYQVIDTDTDNKEPDLDFYYKTLDCRCIDIVTRNVGGVSYSVVCDDEGTFVNDPILTGYFGKGTDFQEAAFYGSILICGLSDRNGDSTGLTDSDVVNLKAHIVTGQIEQWPKKPLLNYFMTFDPM